MQLQLSTFVKAFPEAVEGRLAVVEVRSGPWRGRLALSSDAPTFRRRCSAVSPHELFKRTLVLIQLDDLWLVPRPAEVA